MLQDTVERKPSACVPTKKVEPEDSEKHENMFLSGQFVPYLIRRYAPGNGAVHVQDADKRKRSVLASPRSASDVDVGVFDQRADRVKVRNYWNQPINLL